jgi:hypothetical protein
LGAEGGTVFTVYFAHSSLIVLKLPGPQMGHALIFPAPLTPEGELQLDRGLMSDND